MKKKMYSLCLIVTVAMMASSCNGCVGKSSNSSGDSTKRDSQAKDSTFPKTGPKKKISPSPRDSANQDSAASDSTFPKTGPKGKVKAKAKAN